MATRRFKGIKKLSKEKYKDLSDEDLIDDDYLYITPDNEIYVGELSFSGTTVLTSTQKFNDHVQIYVEFETDSIHTGFDLILHPYDEAVCLVTYDVLVNGSTHFGQAYLDEQGHVVINVPNGLSFNNIKGHAYVILTPDSSNSSIVSNPNLLINGDFSVNQRGQTTYDSTDSNIYGCDRLQLVNGAIVEMINGGIKVALPKLYAGIRQQIEEKDFINLLGKTVTFSVKIKNATLNRGTRQLQIYINGSTSVSTMIKSAGLATLTTTLPETITKLDVRLITYSNDSNTDELEIEYMKLEVGSIATAFSPRPYAEELAMCQRYYQKLRFASGYLNQQHGDVKEQFAFVNTLAKMRIQPSIVSNYSVFIRSEHPVAGGFNRGYATNPEVVDEYDNSLILSIDVTQVKRPDTLEIVNSDIVAEKLYITDGSIAVDAEIY